MFSVLTCLKVIEKIEKNDFQKKDYCLLTNFSFSKEISSSDSQKHLSYIPETIMREINNYIRSNKKFNNIILNYFRSNYRIINVRIWRYLSNEKNNSEPRPSNFPERVCLSKCVDAPQVCALCSSLDPSTTHGVLTLLKVFMIYDLYSIIG